TTGSPLQAGQKVLWLAEVSFHEKFGFSLVVQDIDPSFTLGELEANLNKIRQQLVAENLYDRNKRFELPSDFFRVAVIAPPKAAGLGDFRADADQLQQANLCEFNYFYASFQGDKVESEMQIAFNAVEAMHQSQPYDAVIVIRGGGAKMDLSALNRYSIAKAIAQASVPVLTGIGHERDTTLLDEVAAMRFDTPSKAIAAIRHRIFDGAQRAQGHWFTISQGSQLYVQKQKQTLAEMETTVQRQSLSITERLKNWLTPLHYQIQRQSVSLLHGQRYALSQSNQFIQQTVSSHLQLQKQQLLQAESLLRSAPFQRLESARTRNKQWIQFILSSGPKTQLNRGFAIVKDKPGGQPIKSADTAKRLPQIEITFRDGAIQAIPVEETLN
ncbi:MAG: exodeoxyribonuclease VII large subunit, partial [Hydrogenovibrio sp.]